MMRILGARAAMLLICAAAWPATPAASDPLAVKIVVFTKDKLKEPAKPFPNLAGFVIWRGTAVFKNGSCPDESNTKGVVFCKIACDRHDPDMQLKLFPPTKETSSVVAGRTSPRPTALDVKGCTLTTPQPIRFVYRSAEVVIDDLKAQAPAVYNAIWLVRDPGKEPAIRDFSETKGELEALATSKKNRAAILEISKLAATDAKFGIGPTSNLRGYAAGGQSLVLQSIVKEAAGDRAAALVKLSSDPAELKRSIAVLMKELDKKPALTSLQLSLFATIKDMNARDFGYSADALQDLNIKDWF